MGEEMALHFTKLSTNDDIFDKTSATKPLSKTKLPEKESDPKTMCQLIKDELLLDGIWQHFVRLLLTKKFISLWTIVLIKI